MYVALIEQAKSGGFSIKNTDEARFATMFYGWRRRFRLSILIGHVSGQTSTKQLLDT